MSFYHSIFILHCFPPLAQYFPSRPHFSAACGTTGSTQRQEGRRGSSSIHRGAGDSQRTHRQLLLLQQEVRQCGGSVENWQNNSLILHQSRFHAGVGYVQFCVCVTIQGLMTGHRRLLKIMPKTRGRICTHENCWRRPKRMITFGTQLRYSLSFNVK